MKPASWIIREISTGLVITETFSPTLLKRLNTAKYEAVPILDYLIELNRSIKAGAGRKGIK